MAQPSIRSALVLFVALAACQTLPGEPPCATGCLSSAVSAVSCFIADLGCQCSSRPAIALLAGPCLLASCSPDDLQGLSSAESAACSSFTAGKLTTLVNKDAGTTTTNPSSRPSATGPTASPVRGLGPSPPQVQTVTATRTSQSAGASATQSPDATSASLGGGGQAAIGLSGVIAGAGAVSILMWTWQRRKRRQENALARRKEAIPVDDLASWIRANAAAEEQREKEDDKDDKDGKHEKRERRDLKKQRYTGVNMTGRDGPVELEVPGAVFELPGAVMRHEFEG